MIKRLERGMVVALPSGNSVRLVYRQGFDWVCEFTQWSSRRGEVVFSGDFLRKRGTVC